MKRFFRPRPLKPEAREAWAKTRSRGIWYFLLVHGVLAFGGCLFVSTVFLTTVVFKHEITSTELVWHGVKMALSGYIYGYFLWRWMERLYWRTE